MLRELDHPIQQAILKKIKESDHALTPEEMLDYLLEEGFSIEELDFEKVHIHMLKVISYILGVQINGGNI